jgi:serine/threonine-protein kinase
LKKRRSDAADVRIDIEQAVSEPVAAALHRQSSRPWRKALLWAAVLVLTVGGGVGLWMSKPGIALLPRPVTRFAVTLPPGDRFTEGAPGPLLAISLDGSRLVYSGTREGRQQLYLREIGSLEIRPIPGTEQGILPFFSPDGKSIGFVEGAKLVKVAIDGGGKVNLCDAPTFRGATWGTDDTIYFTPNSFGAIFKVSATGGQPQQVTHPPGALTDRWPQILPGGDVLVFSVLSNISGVGVESLRTGERRVLVQNGAFPHYLPSGHLLFYRDGALMAVQFDPKRLEVKGEPVRVLEGITAVDSGNAADFSVSGTGSLVYLPGGASATNRTLVWVDRKGSVQSLPVPPRAYTTPALSTDGKQIAVTIEGQTSDLWIYDIARGTLTRLTFDGSNIRPLWTPDGKRIVFTATKSGAINMFWKPADGAGAEEQLTNSLTFFRATSISADGKRAFYIEQSANGQDVWSVPLTGERKPTPFLQTPFNEAVAQISPDGHWVAYVSNESGQAEIYVRPFPPASAKWQISTEGGIQPLWARDGKELFYRNGNKTIAVDIASEPTFRAGTPRVLFEGEFEPRPGLGTNFDATPDGQRFLMIKNGGDTASEQKQLIFIENWFEELKRKMPVGR